MSSSQRAESGHAFFKKFVSKNNSLVDFMIQFGRGLVRQRHEELMADHKDVIEKPKLRINHDFLEQMVDIYTNEIYYKFEAEVCDSFNYKLQFVRETDNQSVYQIQRKKLAKSKVREIVYDKDLDLVSCSCKKSESAGIPCTHIISYLMKIDAEILPDKYILKRWTRAKNKKDRRCHGCGKVGQSHDKRNCPALTNLFSTSGDTNLQEGNESSSEDVDLFED
ncbi:protein FAR-RED IMPAIRED RESPONSE 1-like [Asparagus officinalis]|uniref:protein FAR-RED IMPAIRED RESPONSE 1-like n=1 Tax=Asparagus officinalis TaxID=4686 RepID=UPI00098E4DC5|nr:protein FAR-RED IMPAIRED RESPONSE 1-like [Asparagus officinalis]